MSFFGNMNQSKKVQFVEKGDDFILTKKGKDRVGRLDPVGVEYKIMSYLKESEPSGCTIDEIVKHETIPYYKVKDILINSLIRDGLVMVKGD